uniref:WW domain-containing protein n=1 Tax=Palpitomonas bilix TaxID=652834 RepID=A0A7S3DK31_9EUKA|mmetsp:Transcript_40423/g.104797  ORF Transcript_40423/g.104797 Transcript_40423/m.104797 type:complete len:1906 (+) Transcript_40423:268-5985(+)
MELEEKAVIDEVISECRRCDPASSGVVTADEFLDIFNATDVVLKEKERWAFEQFIRSQVEGIEYELLVPRLMSAQDRSDLFRELFDDTTTEVYTEGGEETGEEGDEMEETDVERESIADDEPPARSPLQERREEVGSRGGHGGTAAGSRGGGSRPGSQKNRGKSRSPDGPVVAPQGALKAYARTIGLETQDYKHFLWLAKEGVDQALPEGWTKVTDPEGNTFYSDEATGEKRRIHPNVEYFRKLANVVRAYFSRPDAPKPSQSKDVVNCARDIGLEPAEDVEYFWIAEECLEAPLPENWFQYETSDGEKFYYNGDDESTTWAHPKVPEFTDLANSLKYYLAPEDAAKNKPIAKFAQKIKMLLPEHSQLLWIAEEALDVPSQGLYVKGQRKIPHKYYRDLYTAVKDNLSHNLAASKSIIEYARHISLDPASEFNLLWLAEEGLTAPLPDGWVEVKDDQGETFYYKETTRQSTWRHPADDYYEELAKALVKNLGKNPPASKDIVSTARNLGMEPLEDAKLLWIADECVRSPLPDGWVESYDPAGGTFYFHTKKNISSWTHPADEYYKEVYQRVKESDPADIDYYRFFYLFGKDEKVKEKLMTLQRVYRGYRARRLFKRLMKRNASAKLIQRTYKRYKFRVVLSMHKELVAAQKLVRNVRAFLPRWRFRKEVVRLQKGVRNWLFKKHRLEAIDLLERAGERFLFRLRRRKAASKIQQAFRKWNWRQQYRFLRAARVVTRNVRRYLFISRRTAAIVRIQRYAKDFLTRLRRRKAAALLEKMWMTRWRPRLKQWRAAAAIQRMARKWLSTRSAFHAALLLQKWSRPIISRLRRNHKAVTIQRWIRLQWWRKERRMAVRKIESAWKYKQERWLRKLRRGMDNFFYSVVQVQKHIRSFLSKCRVRDRCFELLVISIQRAVRKFLAARRVKHARENRVQIWAATALQRWVRGAVVRSRLYRMADRMLASHAVFFAATTIQTCWRGYAGRKAMMRRAFIIREAALHSTAVVIQSWWRAERERRYLRLLKLVRERPLAVRRIQQWWRRKRLRERMIEVAEGGFFDANYKYYLEYHYTCAEKIQAAWRGFATRSRLEISILGTDAAHVAATKLQSWWKAVRIATLLKPRLRARMHTRRRNDAATAIQSWYKGCLHRMVYSAANREFLIHTSAAAIQRCYRGWKGRERAGKRRMEKTMWDAATTIQAGWRGKKGRDLAGQKRREKEIQRRTNKRRTQVQVIQAHIRGWLQRQRFKVQRLRLHSAITIQRVYRGHAQRLRTEVLRAKRNVMRGTLLAEALCRAFAARKFYQEELVREKRKNNAVKIQSWLRQRFAFFEFSARRKAWRDSNVAVVQSIVKGYLARKYFSRLLSHRDRLLAAGVIQRNVRMWQQRKRYRRDILAPARLQRGIVSMQRVVRGGLGRIRAAVCREERDRVRAAVRIQAVVRGWRGRKRAGKRRFVMNARQAARKIEQSVIRYSAIKKGNAVIERVKMGMKKVIAAIKLQRFFRRLRIRSIGHGASMFAFQSFWARSVQLWWKAAKKRLELRRQKERRVQAAVERERERRKLIEVKTRQQVERAEKEAELELEREKRRKKLEPRPPQPSLTAKWKVASVEEEGGGEMGGEEGGGRPGPSRSAPFLVGRREVEEDRDVDGSGWESDRSRSGVGGAVHSPRPLPPSSPRKRFRPTASGSSPLPPSSADEIEEDIVMPSPLARSRLKLAPAPPSDAAPVDGSPRRSQRRPRRKGGDEAEEKRRKPRSLRAAEKLLDGWSGAKFSPKVRIKAAMVGGWVRPSEGYLGGSGALPGAVAMEGEGEVHGDPSPLSPLTMRGWEEAGEKEDGMSPARSKFASSVPIRKGADMFASSAVPSPSSPSLSASLSSKAGAMRKTYGGGMNGGGEGEAGYSGFLPPIATTPRASAR